jgi:hypothetical protein
MPNAINWDAEASSPTSDITTGLNSLADGSRVVGSEITTSQKMYLNLELSLAAQGSARSSGAHFLVWLLPTLDGGTTYGYGSSSVEPPAQSLVGAIHFDAATTARVSVLENIPIGHGRYKVCIQNETGQSLAASGNTLKYTLSTPEVQ